MVSHSKSQTQKLAANLAKKLAKIRSKSGRRATIIALQGELGSGKTTFTQGFCKALGVGHGVTSPTFIIMRHHMAADKHIYHFDLYRIQSIKELGILGFKKIISNPENIVLIEWPEKIKKLLPKNTIWVNFEHGKKENERTISFKRSLKKTH